ncbi:phage fiber-tail adaptor protein [Hydrogenophaga sp.]|uniref:phage fiber-tail adaptor protein n=1 Tax=Hydrogenophaga sp. TaxID=1904254 RepID=UPI003F7252B1
MTNVLDTFPQHTTERQDYDISFQRYLARHNDTIETAQVTSNCETLQLAYAFASGVIKVFVQGPPGKHIVVARITTTGGRTRRGAIAIRIKGDTPCAPAP